MSVQVGLGLFTGQIPPGSGHTFAREYQDVVELARLAESLSFDSVWVSEHHGASDGYLPSLLPMLAAVASATERVRLGTGVMLTPFHHPIRLAEDAAVVDQLSGGRLILGLALGWREEEFRMFGIPIEERLRRTTETIQILRLAWAGGRFSHDGRIFRFDDISVTPPPAQIGGPPIYLGGFAEAAVRRAGRIADGYIRSRGGIEDAKEALTWAEEAASSAGKNPAEIGFAQLQNAFVWDDDSAWERVRDGVSHQVGVYAGWREGSDTPGRPLEVPRSDESTLRNLTPAGTPPEVIRALSPFTQAFADRDEFHFIVRLHYPGMELETAAHAIKLFGEDVLPALRSS
ncbi:MAG: LLM class flavin-dependent oxidoreductase [Actinomycetota bacterium]